jgi:hypothetical protein
MKFYLRYLENKGYSLFTSVFIPKHTVIYNPHTSKGVCKIPICNLDEYFQRLDNSRKSWFLHYSYAVGDTLFFPKEDINPNNVNNKNDDDIIWFINHSNSPNLVCNSATDAACVTLRDIYPHEELTENYANYDFNSRYHQLCDEHLKFNFIDILKQWK